MRFWCQGQAGAAGDAVGASDSSQDGRRLKAALRTRLQARGSDDIAEQLGPVYLAYSDREGV